MKTPSALAERKQKTTVPFTGALAHAAVRPVAGHGTPAADGVGHELSQVRTEAANCPITPTRCPFGGACHTCPMPVQTKLRISEPRDRYEQEADKMAKRVMRMPKKGARQNAVPMGSIVPSSHSRQPGLQQASTVMTRAHSLPYLNTPGQPLDAPTRDFMEARFGFDLRHVHVHTNAQAARAADSMDALAFAYGSDIGFSSGRYAPGTDAGRRILAHELAHVVQQGHTLSLSTIYRLGPSRCSRNKPCPAPDVMGVGPANSWTLTLAVDREQKGLGRLTTGSVGHTWIKLSDNAGTKYSYGFWPQRGFDRRKPLRSVAGCVLHPDRAHEPPHATAYAEKQYTLSQENYGRALDHAQSVCKAKPNYNLLSYNCTSFAIDVVKRAGASPPASTTLAVHNPNALYEGITEDRKGHRGLGALIGGLGGAGLGAGIGALLGPVGAIVGGLVGGLVGLVAGTLIGE